MKQPLQNLINYLGDMPTGAIGEIREREIEQLLFKCWGELNVISDDAGLEPYKLLNRTENLSWSAPLLTFEIERHGATVGGSKFAHVYSWTVNVELGIATMNETPKRRQLQKNDRSLTANEVSAITDQLCQALREGGKDQRLRWDSETKVKVLVSAIIPKTNKQTTSARRRRFWTALEAKIIPLGWTRSSAQFLVKESKR